MSNPIAKHAYKFNVAKAFVPKKGKGSYSRKKEVLNGTVTKAY